jgi:hypothetical protein
MFGERSSGARWDAESLAAMTELDGYPMPSVGLRRRLVTVAQRAAVMFTAPSWMA